MNDVVHIVCLDAPSPPDYGGVFDLYYKVPSLAGMGTKIILHYFNYKGYRNAAGLEKYCFKRYSYKRSGFLRSIISGLPYIVSSRINSQLIERINSDDYPVLLEGIHCTGIIPYLKKGKRIVVRIHNDEAVYYDNLRRSEKNWVRKLYFIWEVILLKKYQASLNSVFAYFFVSTADLERFKKYRKDNLKFLPCFLPWQTISAVEGRGGYCLYHGNLSVSENEFAARWLIQNVFSKLNYKLIIAGKNACNKLGKIVQEYSNIEIIESPTDAKLHELIQNAHINVLPSMNRTGVKLKLLHALFVGRFCITNNDGIEGSGIKRNVYIANSADSYIWLIKDLMNKPFTQKEVEARKTLLEIYNNGKNAEKLKTLLSTHYQ